MNLSLPSSTKVNRIIPKNAFYKRFNLNSKQKDIFTHIIKRIQLTHTLSPHTIQVPATQTIEEIQIIKIELRQRTHPKEVLQIINNTISYPILFYLEYQDQYCYAITLKTTQEKGIYYSDWNQDINFSFTGHNLEIIYESLVKKFISPAPTQQNLQNLVTNHTAKLVLEKEIYKLKQKISKEPQLNRRINLNRELKKLETEYSQL